MDFVPVKLRRLGREDVTLSGPMMVLFFPMRFELDRRHSFTLPEEAAEIGAVAECQGIGNLLAAFTSIQQPALSLG